MAGNISMGARREVVLAVAERLPFGGAGWEGPDSPRADGCDRLASQACGAGAGGWEDADRV